MEHITVRTYKLANRIYKLCKKLQEDKDYIDKLLANQLWSSSTSNSNYCLEGLISEIEQIKRILGKSIVTKKSNQGN